MNRPLVSIVIPCHNAERWVAATLESVLAQTWTENEIIVVNDGSTDRSPEIARSFEARGVRVIDQSNRGAAAARNAGVRAARGELLQFLDADDLLSPGKIAAQVAWLESRPAGAVASCAWGRFHDEPAKARFVDTVVFRDFIAVDFLVLAGETGAMMHPSAWLVPRAIAAQAGPWDESLSLNDDGEYFARVALASSGLAFCPDSAARSYYRSGLPGSLSQQRSEKARQSQFRSLELITRHLLETENSPRTRRAAAGYWRRFVHDFYPSPPELIQQAEAAIAGYGESVGEPPMGPKTAAFARVLGWRTVWRLKQLLGR